MLDQSDDSFSITIKRPACGDIKQSMRVQKLIVHLPDGDDAEITKEDVMQHSSAETTLRERFGKRFNN